MNVNFTDIANGLTDCLTRDGQAPMTAPLLVVNGSTSVPAVAFAADPTNGIYRNGAGILGISGALSVVGNTGVGGAFSVSGAASLSSTLNVSGAVTTGGTLVVTGATSLLSSLNVSGLGAFGGALSASSINNTPIGTTTPNSAAFTTSKIGTFNKLSPAAALLTVENQSGLAAQFMNNLGVAGTAVTIRSDVNGSLMLAFQDGASTIGSVVNNGTSVTYATTSDRRLKDDFGEIADPLGLLRVMEPCSFVMKSDEEKIRRYGYIADQFQKALPYAVIGKPGDVLQGGLIKPQQIAMGADGPVTAAAVLKLADKIDELISRIEALEGAPHAS